MKPQWESSEPSSHHSSHTRRPWPLPQDIHQDIYSPQPQEQPPAQPSRYPPRQPSESTPRPPQMQGRVYSRSRPRSTQRQLLQRLLLAGGWLVALLTFVLGWGSRWNGGVIANSVIRDNAIANLFRQDLCREVVQPQAVLSRDQLTQLLTIPERSGMEQVRSLIPEPYCRLNEIEVRAGVMAQREAYPLAFDPTTWLVVLSEEGEYAGYGFRFAH